MSETIFETTTMIADSAVSASDEHFALCEQNGHLARWPTWADREGRRLLGAYQAGYDAMLDLPAATHTDLVAKARVVLAKRDPQDDPLALSLASDVLRLLST